MDPLEKLTFVKQIPQYPQKSPEWFKQRSFKLTSSDAGTVLGLSPYGKPIEVFFKKCGFPTEFTGSVATYHGQKYENEAIEKYCKLMNKTNHEFGLIEYTSINPVRTQNGFENFDLSFLAGSPDGIAIDNDRKKNGTIFWEDLVMLEVKCPYRRNLEYGKCPDYYYPQVQLNMLILDLKLADFIEYIPAKVPPLYKEKPEMNIVRIHRNEKWLKNIIPKLVEFWSEVKIWHSKYTEHPEYPLFISKKKDPDEAPFIKDDHCDEKEDSLHKMSADLFLEI